MLEIRNRNTMKIIDVIRHKKTFSSPPAWMMRQAGRYLPEYKKIRAQHPDFMEFCFSIDDVVEVTLQPLQRFPIDAAIIFSDILVIPHVLGQKVWFETNHGPKLENIDLNHFIKKAADVDFKEKLDPIKLAIQKTRNKLDPQKALIGFAGAPWTILTYMISKGKTLDFNNVLEFRETNSKLFKSLLDLLTQKATELLLLHIESGVNIVQIFESWASAVPSHLHEEILFQPLRKIIQTIHEKKPNFPIIYYGRGINKHYNQISDINLVFGIDETSDMQEINKLLPQKVLQGNLSPQTLLTGNHLESSVLDILDAMQDKPFIFNLGHGINKDTPLSHVERLFATLQSR
ncbi:MAG: uroporphyrinogen decarboxylase [Candidatus Puniceispirillum sp.]|nr:uroporphyrinogen decarboxylase [Candidatus Pelagibacter sp.]MBA4283000.1 uroporphyrinogen decarboxylase [Candidatus Puniceispirillum sp.]